MSNEDDAMNDAANASDTFAAEFGGIVFWAIAGSLLLVCTCSLVAIAAAVEAGWFVP